jgi:hypothetical protein
MIKTEKLNNCSSCKNLFQEPIILPCGEIIRCNDVVLLESCESNLIFWFFSRGHVIHSN